MIWLNFSTLKFLVKLIYTYQLHAAATQRGPARNESVGLWLIAAHGCRLACS